MEALILVVAVALVVISVSRVLWRQHSKLKLPPGPTALPIIGSLHLLGTHPQKSLTKLAHKYGPLMSVWLGQRLCIVATSVDAAKEFLKFQDANFSSRPHLRCADLIMPGDMVMHDITPVFRHLRKILVGELMTANRLKASQYIRTEEMASMLRRLSQSTSTGEPCKLRTHVNIMSTNVLSRMVLGKRFLGVDDGSVNYAVVQEFLEIVEELSVCFSAVHLADIFNVPAWVDLQGLDRRFRALRARMDRLYRLMIDQHKALLQKKKNPSSAQGPAETTTTTEKTLLDVLLEQLDAPELGVTEDHINGLVWDTISAGTDTTTLTIEWAMAEVLHNPTLMKNAKSELDRVVGLDRTVQESDIPNLKYIQAIVKETFRLHPPVPLLIPHLNRIPTKAFGYDIPAETRLMVNVWAIGRDAEIWDTPTEFVPERFLDGGTNATTEFQGQNFTLLPFGSGRRSCPGMGLATISVHFQVASLLHAFDWVPKELNMAEGRPGVTLWKRDPLVAVAKPRLPIHVYHS